MQSQIKWLQLFPSLEDLLQKVFPTRAASAFLSISRQIGNLNFARAVASIQGGGSPESSAPARTPEPGSPTPATGEKKSFVVQIVEKQ